MDLRLPSCLVGMLKCTTTFLMYFPVSFQGLMQEINDLRLRISEMDSERLQYEKKLKSTKVSFLNATVFKQMAPLLIYEY